MLQTLKRNIAAATLASLLSMGGAFAQDANWDKVVAAAKQEGKLLIYNGTNFPIVRKIAVEMQKEYGIPVEVLDGRASEIRERIRIEQSTNRTVASLSYSGFTTLYTQSQEGAFQDHGALPNATGVAPELASKGQVLLGSVGLFILMYNTSLVSAADVPKSWHDLTKPQWQGKILSDDFRAAGAGNVWFEATYNAFGREFHERMAVQKPVFSRNFPDSERRVARGEFPIYIPFNVSEYASLQGLPIKAMVPSEGAAYVPMGAAILKDAPHPNAARVYLNFLLSDRGQAMLAAEGFRPAKPGFEKSAVPEVAPLLAGKLLGTTTPGRLDETTKIAAEIYK
ncbi:MAG: ABC transporter substrate-binding protein [Xanthobacteraceae bacterium]